MSNGAAGMLALLVWAVVLLLPWLVIKCKQESEREQQRRDGAIASTVSGNGRQDKTGPAWEQDYVWAEVFEGDDDL